MGKEEKSDPNKIQIKVHLMGLLGERIGKKQLILELERGMNIRSFLNFLYEEYSNIFPESFLDVNKKTFKMIHFMRNYKDLDLNTDLDLELNEGDEFYLVPPLGGGVFRVNK
ncbi:MAG: MoaD/ThiS family protein [Candidatus Helarchaeota archaeon]|nr:MoaD/ThiS family protein [Candidatus Helarchaeota archaeon]